MAMNQQRLFTERKFEDDVEDEGSESDCYSDDSDTDPSFTMDDTSTKFSDRSAKKKPKARVNLESESEPDEEEVSEQKLDEKDEKSLELVQKVIEAGQIEKLKVDQCKVYLRKNGLRLTGNKGTLIQRIKEHLEILNGGGEKKYPPSSFVLNCKGDACMGDVVMFEQNVYEMFNLASRSASGPPCGTRIVVGRIVKESYGAAKQQHTFTVEVLWSIGEKPLPPLHPLLIKGRNLYRLKTLRQRWEDEGQRQKTLMEKHSRGSLARSDREVRMNEKKMRKMLRETRISRKAEPKKKQTQSNSPAGVEQLIQPQHQQTGCLNGLAGHSQQFDLMKLAGASQASIGLASHFQQVDSSKLAAPFHQPDKMNLARAFQKSSSLVNSRKSTIQPQHAGFSVYYDTAATEHQKNNQMQQMDTRRIYSSSIQDVQHRRSFDCDANYNLQPNHSSLQDHASHNKYPNWSSVKASHVQPLTRNTHMDHSRLQNHASHNKYLDGSSVKDFHAQPLGSNTHMDHSRLQDHVSHNKYSNVSSAKAFHAQPLRSNNTYMDQSRLQDHVSRNKYSNGSSVKDSHVQPLGRNTHMNPPQREDHTLRQPCQHYARGRCYFGENCKFLHEWREEYPQRREEAWRCGRKNSGSRP